MMHFDENKKVPIIEITIGSLLIAIGVILWWWSTQFVWILIHPPPLTKRFIDGLPYIFWMLGTLLIIDGIRRIAIQKNGN